MFPRKKKILFNWIQRVFFSCIRWNVYNLLFLRKELMTSKSSSDLWAMNRLSSPNTRRALKKKKKCVSINFFPFFFFNNCEALFFYINFFFLTVTYAAGEIQDLCGLMRCSSFSSWWSWDTRHISSLLMNK